MGKQKSYLDQYGDSEYSHAFLPKVMITLLVDDLRAEEIARRWWKSHGPGGWGTARFLFRRPSRVNG